MLYQLLFIPVQSTWLKRRCAHLDEWLLRCVQLILTGISSSIASQKFMQCSVLGLSRVWKGGRTEVQDRGLKGCLSLTAELEKLTWEQALRAISPGILHCMQGCHPQTAPVNTQLYKVSVTKEEQRSAYRIYSQRPWYAAGAISCVHQCCDNKLHLLQVKYFPHYLTETDRLHCYCPL